MAETRPRPKTAELRERLENCATNGGVFTFWVDFSEPTFLARDWDPVKAPDGASLLFVVDKICEQISEVNTISSKPLRHEVHVSWKGHDVGGFPVIVTPGGQAELCHPDECPEG